MPQRWSCRKWTSKVWRADGKDSRAYPCTNLSLEAHWIVNYCTTLKWFSSWSLNLRHNIKYTIFLSNNSSWHVCRLHWEAAVEENKSGLECIQGRYWLTNTIKSQGITIWFYLNSLHKIYTFLIFTCPVIINKSVLKKLEFLDFSEWPEFSQHVLRC